MKLYNAMEESYLKENLIHKWVTNIVRQNDGYEFLFDDEVYLPVYKYALKITKRKTVKLNLVEEKVLQIVSIGVHQVDEIAKILGITRPLLDVTLADLHVKDLISVSSDICSLLKKGEQALSNLERVEKQQDIMKDIYMDSFKGKILDDITRYQVVEKGIIDDNKLEPLVQAEDMKVIVSRFEDIQEIFQDEYSAIRIADGIRTETQELLTIDGIESVYVVFIKIPLQVFVSTNGWDIDIVAAKKKYNELLLEYKDEIIRQINNKKVLRAHWKKKTIQEPYNGECLKEVEGLVETIRSADYRGKKKQKEIDELQMKIFSSRKLLNGEAKILLDYLAENAQQVELSVDNVDDWAYDKNFVGKLSHYVGKATLKIKYQSSNNIGKAIEQLQRADDTDLYVFLSGRGEQFKRCGKEYRWLRHDSVMINKNEWYRFSQNKGGHAIDFMKEFYGLSFAEAVKELLGEEGVGETNRRTAKEDAGRQKVCPIPLPGLELPERNESCEIARKYLIEQRKLSEQLVDQMIEKGDIYESKNYHNVVFVGRDKEQNPRYAAMRGTDENRYRGEARGSEKAY